MGLTLWIVAGLVTFALTRFIENRRRGWLAEVVVSLSFAVAAGLMATAMDFGGWAVADGRSFAFAGVCSLLGVGLLRLKTGPGDS